MHFPMTSPSGPIFPWRSKPQELIAGNSDLLAHHADTGADVNAEEEFSEDVLVKVCIPIPSMVDWYVFTYMYYRNQPNVGEHTIHGRHFLSCPSPKVIQKVPEKDWSRNWISRESTRITYPTQTGQLEKNISNSNTAGLNPEICVKLHLWGSQL